MVLKLTPKQGGHGYRIDNQHSAHSAEVDLVVSRDTDPPELVGAIHWEPGADAFHADAGATQSELESLFPHLSFAGAVGHVFGCRSCGAPLVVPDTEPATGTVSCVNGHETRYTLPR